MARVEDVEDEGDLLGGGGGGAGGDFGSFEQDFPAVDTSNEVR